MRSGRYGRASAAAPARSPARSRSRADRRAAASAVSRRRRPRPPRGRPALEQAVGEAAGRGTHVQAGAAGDRPPNESSAFASFTPPRETYSWPGSTLTGTSRPPLARLLGTPPSLPEANLARHHGSRRARSGLEQPALGQQGVEPALRHARQGIRRPRRSAACGHKICCPDAHTNGVLRPNLLIAVSLVIGPAPNRFFPQPITYALLLPLVLARPPRRAVFAFLPGRYQASAPRGSSTVSATRSAIASGVRPTSWRSRAGLPCVT